MGLHLPSQRLRPRLRLIQLSFTEPMPDTHMLPDMPDIPMDTHMPMVSMERDLLMLSQRLMPTMDTLDMPDLMLMAMDTQLMATVSMERDLLMPSQRLMPTMADTTDMPDHTPTDMPDTDMVVISGDKLNSSQLRSSKANNKYQ